MRGREYDIVYGLHSNIPACCIVFFITEWIEENRRGTPYARAVHMDNLNYVPCPACFALRRVNVLRQCDTDCGKPCYREFQQREMTPLEAQTVKMMNYHADEWRYQEWKGEQCAE